MVDMNEMIMTDSPIRFPGLFGDWAFTASSKAIDVGHGVYWYGILIATGLVLALLLALSQRKKYGISEENLYDGLLWGIPVGIVGARVYYVLFYLDRFRDADGKFDFGAAIAFWDGGLAIYGTVIGIIILGACLSRRKGKRGFKLLAMTDLVVMGLLVGQIVGRWGNFMNREAFGAETTVPWRMQLTTKAGELIEVHPTFLYESLWNLAGLIFLIVWTKKGHRKYDGQCTLIYFFWYGLGRAWIEGLRTDSLYIGSTNIRVSQALSLVLVLISLILLILQSRRPHPPEKLYVNRVRAEEAAKEETESTCAKEDK